MDEAIKQIGERLKGLREVLNIPAEEVAELCEISLEHYPTHLYIASPRSQNAMALTSMYCSLARSLA